MGIDGDQFANVGQCYQGVSPSNFQGLPSFYGSVTHPTISVISAYFGSTLRTFSVTKRTSTGAKGSTAIVTI
jgi:hypothetical protein